MLRIVFLSALAVSSGLAARAQAGSSGPQMEIGPIYFFGAAGIDTGPLLKSLPLQSGQSIDPDAFHGDANRIRSLIRKETGHAATDVEGVCCDAKRRLLIFIGLSGDSAKTIEFRKAPGGSERLDAQGMGLYKQDANAVYRAVQSGRAGEDDAHGYSLSDDPAARKIQLEMRAYAVNRGAELERVLADSSSADQREASACLLGYAERSRAQIAALIAASLDPDADVRNNAMRALGVLLASKDKIPLGIDVAPLVGLLWSGKWTDRNKASMALAAISKNRDPAILKQIETAMPPLLEGAAWDASHSYFFLVILGRIGGVPAAGLKKLIASGDTAAIIAAAEGRGAPMH